MLTAAMIGILGLMLAVSVGLCCVERDIELPLIGFQGVKMANSTKMFNLTALIERADYGWPMVAFQHRYRKWEARRYIAGGRGQRIPVTAAMIANVYEQFPDDTKGMAAETAALPTWKANWSAVIRNATLFVSVGYLLWLAPALYTLVFTKPGRGFEVLPVTSDVAPTETPANSPEAEE